MKKKINVIDLDKTLLPYDSFRLYIISLLKRPKFFIFIVPILIMRIMRIIDPDTFKKKIVIRARKEYNYDYLMKVFAEKLFKDIDKSIISKIETFTDRDTINILCTASIDDYVSHLADRLDWKFICSNYNPENEIFIHMHGKNKVKAVENLYPSSEYIYYFAISDSPTDNNLLKKFESGVLINQ